MTAADPAPMTPATLGEAMACWMEAHEGETETAVNSSPNIDEWNRLDGLPVGSEWCAATVHAAGYYAAQELGKVNPVPKTGGAQKIYLLADTVCRVDGPARGRVFVVFHPAGKGHTGVCVSVDAAGVPTCLSGNTNAAGSRLGNMLGRHTGDPAVVHHAMPGTTTKWLDFDLAPQPPAVV